MTLKGSTIKVASVKDVYIPTSAIRRIVHDRATGEILVWTDRGVCSVLEDFAELQAVLPSKCEEV